MYAIEYLEEAIEELTRLDPVMQKRIKEKINLLGSDPASLGNNIKPFKGKHKGKARLRVGDYRVVFQKQDNRIVILIIRIGHRSRIYD